MVFLKFDEGRVDFDGDSKSAEAIRDFIKGNQLPLVSEFTQEVSACNWVYPSPSSSFKRIV